MPRRRMETTTRALGVLAVTAALGAIVLWVAACCGPAVNYPYEQEPSGLGAYRVGPGDILRVAVWGDKTLSGAIKVRPDGRLTMDLIGEIDAEGRAPTDIEQDITKRLARYKRDPRVTVTVAESNSYRVFVTGRVNQPGEFTPDTPITVLQAIALARGLTEYADGNHIVIVRRDDRGPRRIPFVWDAAVKCGRTEMDITLLSGDTVIVP